MKVSAAIIALVAVASAAPEVQKRQFNPASATASLLQVLPSSILNVALTNQAEASTLISEAFSTGTPAWFASLPTAVQSYFLSQAGATAGAGATTGAGSATGASGMPSATGASNSSASGMSASGSSTMTGTMSSSGSSSTGSSGSGSGSGSGTASSSSSGSGAYPTAVIGGGLAGLVGLVGMLAL